MTGQHDRRSLGPLKSFVKAPTCFFHCYFKIKFYGKIRMNLPHKAQRIEILNIKYRYCSRARKLFSLRVGSVPTESMFPAITLSALIWADLIWVALILGSPKMGAERGSTFQTTGKFNCHLTNFIPKSCVYC